MPLLITKFNVYNLNMNLVILLIVATFTHSKPHNFTLNSDPDDVNTYLKSGSFQGYFTPREFWSFHHSIQQNPDYSSLISNKEVIGRTINKNAIYGFYLCDDITKLNKYKQTKNIIMMTALHHSREPLTITMMILMTINLLKEFKKEGHNNTKELFRDNIIFFIPTLNIDSYIYMNRMYRKGRASQDVMMIRKNRNVSRQCGRLTGGVDLNRNYDYKFALDNSGSSNDPCAEDFRGPHPFSEKETQAVKLYVDTHPNIVSCVNIHSYGNAWIYPFNYVHDGSDHFLKVHEPVFFDFYKEFEQECQNKGRKAHFGNSAFVLDYSTNGEAGDWFTGAKNILNLDVELGTNNKKTDTFYPPRDLIPKIVRYNWIVMNDFLNKHIINLDLTNITIQYGYQPTVIFQIFNQSISNLKDVELHLKPLFVENEKVRAELLYTFKMNPNEKGSKIVVNKRLVKGTFRGRYILEIDVRFSSESLVKKFIGLELKIKRKEDDYFGYPDQKYVFKLKKHEVK